MFAHKHLLSIDDLSPEDIMTILKQARTFEEINERPIKKVPALRGKTVCNLFLEPSTRTRGSFELAEKRLSCDSLNAGGSTSSTVKGESLVDTVRTLDSMKVDMFISALALRISYLRTLMQQLLMPATASISILPRLCLTFIPSGRKRALLKV